MKAAEALVPEKTSRFFVYVEDVANVNLWFLNHPQHSGIYNVGTGRSQSFNDVANSVIRFHGKGSIEYIPFPESLKKPATKVLPKPIFHACESLDTTNPLKTVEQAVPEYLQWLRETCA